MKKKRKQKRRNPRWFTATGYVSEFLQKGPEIGKGQGISESC